MEVIILTVGVAVGDQELQHLVHGTHEEDQPQLGHRHGDETPQEDRSADRMPECHCTRRRRELM